MSEEGKKLIAALIRAVNSQRASNFAVLKELQAHRRYKKNNPPQRFRAGIGACEQCGWYAASFDEYLHHLHDIHQAVLGELLCPCAECNPDAAWNDLGGVGRFR